MATNFTSLELGNMLGQNMSNFNLYRDDFVETEELADLNLYLSGTLNITGVANIVSHTLSCSAFILGHPLYGDMKYNSRLHIVIPLQDSPDSAPHISSYSGVPSSITYASAGSIGGSTAVFNRTSSKIQYETFPTITAPYTLNAWVLFTSITSAQQSIIDLSGDAPGGQPYPVFHLRSNGRFLGYCGGEKYVYSNTTMTSSDYNTWKMVTFLIGSSSVSDMSFYLNGASNTGNKGNNSGSYYNPYAEDAYIGADAGTGNWWGGSICDVSIFNRLLTGDEIYELYTSGHRAPNCGLYGLRLNGNIASSTIVGSYEL